MDNLLETIHHVLMVNMMKTLSFDFAVIVIYVA